MVARAHDFDSVAESAPFQLTADSYPAGALRVLSFRGKEAISTPFRFDVTIGARHAEASSLESDLLGKPACLTLEVPRRDPRAVRGIIAAVEAQGAFEQGRHTFRLRLVPALWLLKKRKTSRVFQDKTVPDIVAAVLEQATIAHRFALLGKYPRRTYCVQHQETDFAFVTRLLAEEGIFYFFDHGAGEGNGEKGPLVLSDSAHLYPAIDGEPELAHRYEDGSEGLLPDEHHVQRFSLCHTVQPSSLLQRDYDFRRPVLDLAATASTTKAPSIPPGAPSNDAAPCGPEGRVYEHHGEDDLPDVDRDAARVRLDQHRRRAQIARGESACRRLLPGHKFTLGDHDVDTLNQGYVIARVEHVGRSPEIARGREKVYSNRFECAPEGVPLRPKPPARRLQQVTETAIVVGPEGQEIHTDEHGRVKVQFHWDLEGKRNEHSSCWIRVSQAWAGTHWGFTFIPRVGMEVVVTFLGGDVDRPLIMGCLYNAINPPSQPLPNKMTRSGIRTRSTPGGTGFNELTFDDRAGEEQVLLRAQRRLDEVILGDHSISIGGEERSSLAGGRTDALAGSLDLQVGGARRETVAGAHREEVGDKFERVVHGEQHTAVHRDASTEIGGNQTLTIRGDHHVIVGHGRDRSQALLYINGDYTVGVAQELRLSAKRALKLSVGDSSLELTPEGIKLSGKIVLVEGESGASMSVRGHELKMGEKIVLASDEIELLSSKGSIVMNEDVHVDGKLVKLNCKPKAADKAKQQENLPEDGIATFCIKQRTDGGAKAGVKLLIATPSGEVIEKETDADGKVQVKGNKGEKFVLVGVLYGDDVFAHQNS